MTVSSTTFRTPWVAANGSNKNWSYGFYLRQLSHVVIQVRNNTTGVITEFTSNIGFFPTDEVSGYAQYPAVGSAVAAGNSVRVVRRVPYTQNIAIGNEGAFDPELHEDAFDIAELQMQQVAEGVTRGIQVPDGSIGGAFVTGLATDEILTSDGANGVKGSGTNILTIAGNVAAAAASAAAALASQIAAAVSAAAALVSQNAAAASATAANTSKVNAGTSETNAAASAAAALTSKNNAATSETNAAGSATTATTQAGLALARANAAGAAQVAAESARDATLAAYDSFDDRYLGVFAANPTLDNDGNALVGGALYFNSTAGEMRVYTGTIWTAAYISPTGLLLVANNLSDLNNTATARANLSVYSKAEMDAYHFAAPAKTTLVAADTVAITDSAAANVQKKITWANFILQMVAAWIVTNKATPVGADKVTITDSAAADVPKYSTLTQIMATIFASPTFTGVPVAPTAAPGTNTTQVGTTAFTTGAIATASALAMKLATDNLAITAGFTHTQVDDGTKASGTYTPSPLGGNYRKCVNNGAFTLAAPTQAGSYNMEIDFTNGATAGAITFSGFISGYPRGDVLTTTNASKFKLHISKTDAGCTAVWEALQ
jgi:hypothetical protein